MVDELLIGCLGILPSATPLGFECWTWFWRKIRWTL